MMLTSSALFLFVMGTAILLWKMPNPSSRHSVDTVVKTSMSHLKDDKARKAAARELERVRAKADELERITEKYQLKGDTMASFKKESKQTTIKKNTKMNTKMTIKCLAS